MWVTEVIGVCVPDGKEVVGRCVTSKFAISHSLCRYLPIVRCPPGVGPACRRCSLGMDGDGLLRDVGGDWKGKDLGRIHIDGLGQTRPIRLKNIGIGSRPVIPTSVR